MPYLIYLKNHICSSDNICVSLKFHKHNISPECDIVSKFQDTENMSVMIECQMCRSNHGSALKNSATQENPKFFNIWKEADSTDFSEVYKKKT